MANDRKNLSSEDAVLPAFSLDDEDDAWGEPKTPQGGPVRRFTTGFFKELSSRERRVDALKSLLTVSLPDGYSRSIGVAQDAWQQTKTTASEMAYDNAEDLEVIAKKTESLLPHLKSKAPKRVYAKIETQIGRVSSGLGDWSEQKRYARRDPDEIQSKRDDSALIESMAELDSAADDNDQTRHDQTRAERNVYSRIHGAQVSSVNRRLEGISSGIERQVGYQDQITYRFQKKSLELQYRSYYALRDLRSYAQSSRRLDESAYTALIHNTALSEFQKKEHADRSRYGEKANKPGFVSRMLSKTLSDHLGAFVPTLVDNIKQQVAGAVRMGSTVVQAGEGAGDMDLGQAAEAAGRMAADGLANHGLQKHIIPGVARLLKPMAQKYSNKLGGFDHLANYGINNAASVVQDFTEESAEDTGMMGKFKSLIRGIAPRYFLDDEITEGSYQTIDREAAFNQLTQRSITDIIPGYLSRILHETRMLRTGDDTSDREVYDITSGKFTTEKAAKAGVRGRVVNEVQRQSINNTLSSVVSKYDTEGDLSSTAQEALRERLLRDAANGDRFDARKYTSGEGYSVDANRESIDELTAFFKTKFEMDEDGKLARNAQNYEQLDKYSSAFLELRDVVPDPRQEIRRLHGAGNQEFLREMGIVTSQNGVDRINYDKLWEMYRTEKPDQDLGGGVPPGMGDVPPAPPGPDAPKPDSPYVAALKRRAGKVKETVTAKMTPTVDRAKEYLNPKVDAFKAQAETGADALVEEVTSTVERFKAREFGFTAPAVPAQDTALRFKADVMSTFKPVSVDLMSGQARPTDDPGYPPEYRSIASQPNMVSAAPEEQAPTPSPNYRSIASQPNVVSAEPEDRVKTASKNARSMFQPIGDVYTPYRPTPLLLARDLASGNYTDTATGHTVHSLKDVTGTVINRTGWVVATDSELSEELKDTTGRSVKTNVTGTDNRRFASRLSGRGVFDQIKNEVKEGSRFRDLHLKGREKASILARDLIAGKYINADTGEVIETIDDITGSVKDKDTGNTVLTPEDIESGLYDDKGERIIISGFRRKLNRYMNITTTPARYLGSKLIRAGGKVGGHVASLFATKDRDAYLPEEDDPRITVANLKAGKYFDAKSGAQLMSFDDITGGVDDADGNEIISKDQRKHLIYRSGEKHKIAKGPIGKFIRRALKGAAKGYLNASKNYYKKLGKFLAKTAMKPWAKSESEDGGEEIPKDVVKTPTDGILSRIHKVLAARLPETEDKPRTGSWRDIMARRKAEKAEDAKDDEGSASGKGAFGGMAGALGSLLNKFRGRGDDEEDGDSDDDTIVNIDGGDGDRDERRRRRRDRRPRGRMGKLWDGTKNLAKKGWDKAGVAGRALAGTAIGAKALSAGKMLMRPAAHLVRGAAWAVSALGSVLSAPVVIGAAVVGGAAIGGYMYYKRRKAASGVFRELRLTQYGFSPNGWGSPKKLLAMEDMLEPIVVHKPGQDPKMDISRLDTVAFYDLVGIDNEDEEELQNFLGWFQKRFMPVFLAYHAGLEALAPELKLQDLDDKLDADLGLEFLKQVTFKDGELSPYNWTADPFDEGDTVGVDSDDIASRIAAVKAHYKTAVAGKEKETGKDGAAAAGSGAVAAKIVAAKERVTAMKQRRDQGGSQPGKRRGMNVDGGGKAATLMATGTGVLLASPGESGETATVSLKMKAQSKRLATQSVTSQQFITPLQAIRFRLYGFDHINSAAASGILGLEEEVFQAFKVQSGGGKISVDLNVRTKTLYEWWMEAYPDNPTTLSSNGFYAFSKWFSHRMVPVLVSYVTAISRIDATVPIARGESAMNAAQLAETAKRLMSTTGQDGRTKTSVFASQWRLTPNPVDPNALKALAEQDYLFLKGNAQREAAALVAQVQVQKPVSEKDGKPNMSRLNGYMKTPTGNSAGADVNGLARDLMFDGAPSPLDYRVSNYQPGGSVGAQGNVFGGMMEGNGGMWESIPMPKSNRSMKAALPTLQAVGAMAGVDAGILVTFASIESAFDYKVKAKTSSATGWFQFINATWDQMIDEHGDKYQIPKGDSQRSLRKDPRVNALMGAEFLKGNYKTLEKAIGRKPTDTDLYLAHFMGAGGATKFLKQDTNAPAARIFPAPAKANRSIFYKPGGESRTIGEVYQLMDEKVSKHRYGAGSSQSVTQQVRPGEPVIQIAPSYADGAFVPVGKAPQSAPSLSSRTGATANPLNGYVPGGMSASPAAVPPQSSTAAAAVTNTPDDPVIQRQTEAKRSALAADRREQVQGDQNTVHTKAMGQLIERQLTVQETMRDYLKEIAQTLSQTNAKGGNTAGGETAVRERKSNDTSKPAPTRSPGPATSNAFPLNLRE